MNFPSNLKPSVSEGYGFDASKNVLRQDVQGGVALQMLDYKYSPVNFQINIVTDPLGQQVFQDFYYGSINSGADKFVMQLDSGMGIEDHAVFISYDTVSFDVSRYPIIAISFNVEAEKIPAQDAPFGGELSELYEIYGPELDALLKALATFTLVTLP